MKNPAKLFQIFFVCILLGLVWSLIAKISRIPNVGITRPVAFYQLFAAIILAACQGIFEKDYPRIYLKTLASAITIASIYYLLPAFLAFLALKELPPFVGAMAFGLVPLWLWVFRMGRGKSRPIFLALGIAGIGIFFLGTSAYEKITFNQSLYLLLLVVATFFLATGTAISKKLFWIHSALELNIWGLVLSALFSYLIGFALNDTWNDVPDMRFWGFIIALSFVTAVSSFLYRYVAFHLEQIEVLVLTLMFPIASAICALIFFREETPINIFSIAGIALYLGTLGLASKTEGAALWLSHCITNTRRQGDRVVTSISGFIQKEKGALSKLVVNDLSIGGLGFKCDTAFAVGDKVNISFPLGQTWSQLAIECKIVHLTKTNDTDNPWHGGVMFLHPDENTLQILVEFLAKLGHAAEQH